MTPTDAPEPVTIHIPPIWDTVLAKFVLCVGGPMDGKATTWFEKLEKLVMEGVTDGWYELSPGGNFAVWTKDE